MKGRVLPTALSIVGIILASYAVYVKHRIEGDDEFVALCDIESIGASCSRTFMLPQGKLLSYFGIVPNGHFLDIPNAVLGLAYYLSILILELTGVFSSETKLLLAFLGFSSSVYLAYVLLMLNEFCVLCWTTHAINFTLLLFYVTCRNSHVKQE